MSVGPVKPVCCKCVIFVELYSNLPGSGCPCYNTLVRSHLDYCSLLFRILSPGSGCPCYNTLVRSHLDYCSLLFRILSSFNLQKLQCVQSTFACSVTNCGKCAFVSPLLKIIHWLSVEYLCVFKTNTLVNRLFQR